MPRLILLNGAPASGKSTLARRWADEHRLALALDIDVVRAMLGASLADPHGAGLTARRLAVAMIRAHLADGLDVIVPQYLGRVDFIDELALVAHEAGAEFVEIVLELPLDVVRRRFADRPPTTTAARDAAALVASSSAADPLAEMHGSIVDVAERRSATVRVDAGGDVETVLTLLRTAIG